MGIVPKVQESIFGLAIWDERNCNYGCGYSYGVMRGRNGIHGMGGKEKEFNNM